MLGDRVKYFLKKYIPITEGTKYKSWFNRSFHRTIKLVSFFKIRTKVLQMAPPLLLKVVAGPGASAAARGPILARRISRVARRGENIISGSGPFLIFQLHYDVLQTSWVANSIANALNTTLLRPAGIERRYETPIYLNFCSDSIWEIVVSRRRWRN